jgi:hypothetical protein
MSPPPLTIAIHKWNHSPTKRGDQPRRHGKAADNGLEAA